MLDRYLSDHGQSHWKAAKKVLRYLQDTKDLMLTYRRTNTLRVVFFRDSHYVGSVDDKNSVSGYIFMMAKVVVSWKSVKADTYSFFYYGGVACYEATCHVIWL